MFSDAFTTFKDNHEEVRSLKKSRSEFQKEKIAFERAKVEWETKKREEEEDLAKIRESWQASKAGWERACDQLTGCEPLLMRYSTFFFLPAASKLGMRVRRATRESRRCPLSELGSLTEMLTACLLDHGAGRGCTQSRLPGSFHMKIGHCQFWTE